MTGLVCIVESHVGSPKWNQSRWKVEGEVGEVSGSIEHDQVIDPGSRGPPDATGIRLELRYRPKLADLLPNGLHTYPGVNHPARVPAGGCFLSVDDDG